MMQLPFKNSLSSCKKKVSLKGQGNIWKLEKLVGRLQLLLNPQKTWLLLEGGGKDVKRGNIFASRIKGGRLGI